MPATARPGSLQSEATPILVTKLIHLNSEKKDYFQIYFKATLYLPYQILGLKVSIFQAFFAI